MINFMFFEFFLLNYDDILQNWRQEHLRMKSIQQKHTFLKPTCIFRGGNSYMSYMFIRLYSHK